MNSLGSDGDGAENWRERRHRVLKGGRIVFNGGYSALDCVIRNLSTGGAMLELDSLLGVPNRFDLMIAGSDGKARPCVVVWRTDKRMGVAFDTQSRP